MIKKPLQRWLGIDTLVEGQASLNREVDLLGKATASLIRTEEKKRHTKRAKALEVSFKQQAEAKWNEKPALRAVKGGRA
jgi:hypothetical protein